MKWHYKDGDVANMNEIFTLNTKEAKFKQDCVISV